MSGRTLGTAMMALGAVVALVGVIGWATSGGYDTEPVAATTTTSEAPSTTAPNTATTASAPTTQDATTTTVSATTSQATTTTAPQTTTTTVSATDVIAAFVPAFAQAIADGDVDGLMATLHPAVIAAGGEELCRAFVEREILELMDYRLTGEVTGPRSATFGSASVEMYEAPIAFTFQGAAFDDTAQFTLVDGEVRWFATCR
jgi:cytoskeletal protein RodZ